MLIREDIRQLNDTYAQLTCKERVLLDKPTDTWVDYDDLIGLLEMGEEKYVVASLRQRHQITTLLGYFEQERESFFKVQNGVRNAGAHHDFNFKFDITNHFKLDVVIQQSFDALNNELSKLQELDKEGKLKEEITDFHHALDELRTKKTAEESKGILNRLGGLLKKVQDGAKLIHDIDGAIPVIHKIANELGPQLFDLYRGYSGDKVIGI